MRCHAQARHRGQAHCTWCGHFDVRRLGSRSIWHVVVPFENIHPLMLRNLLVPVDLGIDGESNSLPAFFFLEAQVVHVALVRHLHDLLVVFLGIQHRFVACRCLCIFCVVCCNCIRGVNLFCRFLADFIVARRRRLVFLSGHVCAKM